MARATTVISISMPKDILVDLIKWARVERKTKTELLRDAFAWYRSWKLKKEVRGLREQGQQLRKKFNLKTEEDLYKFIHSD